MADFKLAVEVGVGLEESEAYMGLVGGVRDSVMVLDDAVDVVGVALNYTNGGDVGLEDKLVGFEGSRNAWDKDSAKCFVACCNLRPSGLQALNRDVGVGSWSNLMRGIRLIRARSFLLAVEHTALCHLTRIRR